MALHAQWFRATDLRILCITLGLFLALFVTPVTAQDSENDGFGERLREQQIFELLSGNSFWSEHGLDRFYFAPNGELYMQFAQDLGPYKKSVVLKGHWTINKDEPCILFHEMEVRDQWETSNWDCMHVYRSDSLMRPFGKYDDPLFLVSTKDSKTVRFFLNRWTPGNIIVKPERHPDLMRELENMKQYTDISFFNTHQSELPQIGEVAPYMNAYLKTIIGKVMEFPLDYFYFLEDGTYYALPKKVLEFLDESPEAIEDKSFTDNAIGHGHWFVTDNFHCWTMNDRATLCNAVHPGNILYEEYDGYVFQVFNGFLWRSYENGFTPIEQSPHKHIFLKD